MNDPLVSILPYLDASAPLFTADEVSAWPAETLPRLMAAGFIRPAKSAACVACPNCYQEHSGEVTVRRGPDGRSRFFIHCPEALRVEVPAESLRQWTVDLDRLGRALAGALSLAGRRTLLVPGRLWRLGRTKWQGASRDVLFARGLLWPDGPAIIARIETQTRPVVIVANQVPPPAWWRRRSAPVIALVDVATLSDRGVELNIADVAAAITEADARNETFGNMRFDEAGQRQRLRRQVKEELKSHLMDDQLLAAYREHGSYRKAADAISKQTGAKITKDQVSRAVRRAGGITAVASVDDSRSVVRTVASHHRDSGRKTVHFHKSK